MAEYFGYNVNELERIGDSYYLFETGEFVGEALPDQFQVKDAESLEWVMQKLFDAESDAKNEADKIEALLKAYEARKKKLDSRVNWLRSRFEPEIEQYAKTQITDKQKYVDTPFGRIQFRSTKGGLRVADKAKALEWAKAAGQHNVIKVTEEFQISQLDASQVEYLLAKMPEGFEVKPDSVNCSIKTAVAK